MIDSENYLFALLRKHGFGPFKHLIERSRYNRRRKQRHGLTERLRLKLANEMAEGETVFVIDSMPILLTKLQKINLN